MEKEQLIHVKIRPDTSSKLNEIFIQFVHTLPTNHVPQIYYIDAIDRFPLKEFSGEFPMSRTNQVLYENIRVLSCLDLEELYQSIKKITQSIHINTINDRKSGEIKQLLLLLNGLELMYRTTKVKGNSFTHSLLNHTMLTLRLLSNGKPNIKIVILLPTSEFPNTLEHISDQRPKRMNNWKTQGNMLGDYIIKFYNG